MFFLENETPSNVLIIIDNIDTVLIHFYMGARTHDIEHNRMHLLHFYQLLINKALKHMAAAIKEQKTAERLKNLTKTRLDAGYDDCY